MVLRRRLLKAVLVTLKTGETFRGVLWQHDREAVVLRNVAAVDPHADQPTAVDGEVVVFVADVAFLQFV